VRWTAQIRFAGGIKSAAAVILEAYFFQFAQKLSK